VLVAYNVWVSSVEVARTVAPLVRGPAVRALGLAVGRRAQVSCNLVNPAEVNPAQAYDTVRHLVEEAGGAVEGAELVGLLPAAVLQAIPASRWGRLGLGAEMTVEARLGRPA
jgi:glutamate formiminotransferase